MATNVLGIYDPLFYANEALIALESALGMSGRVHRGYDKDSKAKGSTIEIKKPGIFTAMDAPSYDQNIETTYVEMKLDQWKEVKFSLTDKELSFTGDQIISDHIRPAVYALAKDIDTKLNSLASYVPWYVDAQSVTSIDDLTNISQVMFDNKVAMDDGSLHLEVGSTLRGGFQKVFANNNVAGTSAQDVLKTGHIGTWLGYEIFGNQNVGTHTKGTCSAATLAVNGALGKGASFISLDASAVTGTLLLGDTFSIAGDSQRYAVVNDTPVTASGNCFAGVQIYPPLAQAVADNAVVTVSLMNFTNNIAFHRNAFALAMAPLSDVGEQLGNARVATVSDPVSKLAMRSRIWYAPDTSAVKVALDVLYGVKCLDPNMACLLRK
ncbi:MAG: P22 phage major capsid protein family protein [Chlorobiaceae bacterium]